MKLRLDSMLVLRGLAGSVREARALIMAGVVEAEGRKYDKPGVSVEADLRLTVKPGRRYVSRAGDKLASVADELHLDFKDMVVLDVGSSTGGFTDFALQHGARRVYCVDVGTGQLDWKLRGDSRVVVMEQTDIRAAKLPEKVVMAVVDVSFVSLKRVLVPTAQQVRPGGLIVAMAKPQFEAPKSVAGRHRGVIRDEAVRAEIFEGLKEWIEERFEVLNEAESKVPGAEGNVERFLVLRAKPAVLNS